MTEPVKPATDEQIEEVRLIVQSDPRTYPEELLSLEGVARLIARIESEKARADEIRRETYLAAAAECYLCKLSPSHCDAYDRLSDFEEWLRQQARGDGGA